MLQKKCDGLPKAHPYRHRLFLYPFPYIGKDNKIIHMNETKLAVSPYIKESGFSFEVKTTPDKKKKERIWEVDFLRGVLIILVMFYHFAWDMASLSQFFSNWNSMAGVYPGLYSASKWFYGILASKTMDYMVGFFSGGFLFLTGLSCSLSRSNIKRSLKLLGIALALTLLTYILSKIIGSDEVIIFGILHCMGFSLLVYSLFELLAKALKFEISPWALLIIGAGMFAYGFYLEYFFDKRYYSFNELNFERILKIILGFAGSYNDNFSLLPHMGKIIIGIAIGKWVYGGKRGKKSLLPKWDKPWNKPVCFLGRHTLVVYIVHQPIIWIILGAILLSMGYTIV